MKALVRCAVAVLLLAGCDQVGDLGELSDAGRDACVPTTCATLGKNCDPIPDGCGGTLHCGTCDDPETCGGGGEANVCGEPACVAESNVSFCRRLGKDCDVLTAVDNCHRSRSANCGQCAGSLTCGGAGVPNVCGLEACTPESDTEFCARLGKGCGQVSGTDDCQSARTVASCGSCVSPDSCGGSGVPGVCGQGADAGVLPTPDGSVVQGPDSSVVHADGGSDAGLEPGPDAAAPAPDAGGADAGPVAGESWRAAASVPTTSLIRAVTWSGTQWLAAVSDGTVLSSADGLTWTPHQTGTIRGLRGVAWTGTHFVTVGEYGATLSSPDGVTWTPELEENLSRTFQDVVWAGSRVVIVGGAKYYMGGDPYYVYPGMTVAGAVGGTWQVAEPTEGEWLNGVAWTGSQLLAVGESGALLMSTNGTTWVPRVSNATVSLQDVAWGTDRAVVVGWGGTVLTSPDTLAWTVQPTTTTSTLSGVAWTGRLFVAVGQDGTILTSPDGQGWTPRASGTTSYLHDVAYNGHQLVAVGGDGTIVTSP